MRDGKCWRVGREVWGKEYLSGDGIVTVITDFKRAGNPPSYPPTDPSDLPTRRPQRNSGLRRPLAVYMPVETKKSTGVCRVAAILRVVTRTSRTSRFSSR